MSRLDYCNSVLAGLPQSTLQPLQRVQNATARLICDVPYHEHITPYQRELHWLPVHSRTEYKLCLTMYSVHNGRCPSYLSDMLQPADSPSRPTCAPPTRRVTSSRDFGRNSENGCCHILVQRHGINFQSTPDNCRLSLFSSENFKKSCSHVVSRSPSSHTYTVMHLCS